MCSQLVTGYKGHIERRLNILDAAEVYACQHLFAENPEENMLDKSYKLISIPLNKPSQNFGSQDSLLDVLSAEPI